MLGNMLFADGNFQLIVVAMVADFRGESGKEDELGLKKLSNISWSLRDSADLVDW